MDENIILELRKNARIKLSEMSRKFSVPISTLHYRLNSLKPFISRFTCFVNFELFGLKRTIFIIPSDDFLRIQKHSNINNAFFAGDVVIIEWIGKERLPDYAYSAEVISVLKQEEFQIN